MKLQLQAHSLRLRIDEAELALLLAGETLALHVPVGTPPFLLTLKLGGALHVHSAPHWVVELPRAEITAYVQTLPNRAACVFALAATCDAPVTLEFEVDVRDSLQQRGPRRRQPG